MKNKDVINFIFSIQCLTAIEEKKLDVCRYVCEQMKCSVSYDELIERSKDIASQVVELVRKYLHRVKNELDKKYGRNKKRYLEGKKDWLDLEFKLPDNVHRFLVNNRVSTGITIAPGSSGSSISRGRPRSSESFENMPVSKKS